MDVGQIIKTLRDNAGVILRIALVISAAAAVVTMFSKMQFTSTCRLYFGELEERERAPSPSGQELDLSAGHADLASEIEILKSRSLASRAVLASGLNVWIRPFRWHAPRYWRWLAAKRDPNLLDASNDLAATNASLADGTQSSAEFAISFLDDVDYEVDAGTTVLGRGKLGKPDTFGNLRMTLVAPGPRGPGRGARYQVTVRSVDDTADDALKVLDVSSVAKGGTGDPPKVASLRFSNSSPRTAANFLDALMHAYLDERQSWKTEEATAAEKFVAEQLKGTRESLDQLQAKLAAYRTQNRVATLDVDAEAKAMVEQMGKFEQEQVEARLQVAALASVQGALKNPKAPLEAYMMGEANDPVLTGLATSLADARQKATELETRFNGPAPELREQQTQVTAQRHTIDNYVTSRLARARDSVRSLDAVIAQNEERLKKVPGAEVGLTQLTREAEVYSSMYSYLLKRQQEAAIVRASTISKNRILDPASVSEVEDSPKLAFVFASPPFGVLIGAVFVVLRGFFSSTIQNESDLRHHLGSVPIFAKVPCDDEASAGGSEGSDLIQGVPARCIEAFRTLRTNLYYITQREHGNVVLVTSPSNEDGKSTCAFRLASTLALAGQSTLLINADLRQTLPDGEDDGAGLPAVLLGKLGWRDAAREVLVSTQAQFQMLDRGTGASAEMLSSIHMHHFMSDVRRMYDFIIFDVPSFPAVSDALLLSGFADCVVSVIRLEHTPRRLAREHVQGLAGYAPAHGLVVQSARA